MPTAQTSTAQTSAGPPPPRASTARRRWGFAGLAVMWYLLSTFIPLGLPNVAVVLVLGLLVMLSVEPDSRFPTRGVAACRRNSSTNRSISVSDRALSIEVLAECVAGKGAGGFSHHPRMEIASRVEVVRLPGWPPRPLDEAEGALLAAEGALLSLIHI